MPLKGLKTALILLGVLGFCLPLTARGSESAPILLGGTVSMEGKYQEPSGMIRNGFLLWERDVNRRGGLLGRPVQLILYDDKSRKDRIRPLYEKLILQDRVDLVLSPYGTPLTLPASEVTEEHGMVMLACGASGEQIWERGHRYVFGVYALAGRYFIGLMDLMARQGLRTLSILHEDSPFHRDVAEGTKRWAQRFGLNVLASDSFSREDPDLALRVRGLAEAGPEGVVISAYSPEGHDALQIMERQQYRPGVLGMTIAPVHPDFPAKAGSMAEGVFGPSQWEPDERIPFPGTRSFIREFVDRFKTVPSYHAGSAYASCQILERAVSETRSFDQEAIRAYIQSMDTVTVIGRFKTDNKGKQVGHNPIIIQWQEGKKEIVYPIKMQTAPPRF